MMADFTELEKTFDVASEVVADVKKVGSMVIFVQQSVMHRHLIWQSD